MNVQVTKSKRWERMLRAFTRRFVTRAHCGTKICTIAVLDSSNDSSRQMQDRSARVFCSQLIWTRHASESLLYFAAEALRHNVIGDPQFARVPDAPRSGGTMRMVSCCAGAVVKCGTQNNVIGTSRLTVSTGHSVPKTSIPHTYSRPILLVPYFAFALRLVIVPI